MASNDENRTTEDKRVAMLSPSVEIPREHTNSNGASSSAAGSASSSRTVLRPDMAIGTLPNDAQRAALPKPSRDAMFPAGFPPDMALEITSCSPKKDLETKQELFMKARAKRVHTVRRDKRGNGKNAFHKVPKLQNERYVSATVPISNQPIDDPDACNITSEQLIHPPSPDHNVRKNAAKDRAKTLRLVKKADVEKS